LIDNGILKFIFALLFTGFVVIDEIETLI